MDVCAAFHEDVRRIMNRKVIMTTTVTVKTHSWPVEVTTTDQYQNNHVTGEAQQLVSTTTTTVETVPPESSRDFYITNSRSLTFAELPLLTAAATQSEA